jgi:hypothetical protein
MQTSELFSIVRDNVFAIAAFSIGVAIAIFSVAKPWSGGLWKYPSDPVEQKRLAIGVAASLVGMAFMLLHIYTR